MEQQLRQTWGTAAQVDPGSSSSGRMQEAAAQVDPGSSSSGKCSHGGLLDFTRLNNAKGGINKDGSLELFSPHYYLHGKAVDVATKATINFFRDLRGEVDNDLVFGRYMGYEQTTSIGFVIDSTGSMGPYIDGVRMEVFRIIDERAKNGELPAMFMLVPFNDPDFGPVYVSKNVSQIKSWISEINPNDGGDEPEMFFSGLMLCLSAIEPQSEIFIFTDASAKDADLQPQAAAIAEKKKCKVNVVVVRTPGYRRFFDNQRNFQRKRRSINALSYYDEIAFSSGGLALHPTSSEFQSLMVVIGDLSKTQQVNILNVRDVDTTNSTVFRFPVDSSTSNIVIFYTGALYTLTNITISDPSGTRDDAVAGNTTLLSTQISGNNFIMQLREPKVTGIWQIQITSAGLSSLRIIGQSSLNFIYKFGVEDDVGPHPGIRVITNRPSAGVPLLVEVTITGEDASSAVAETLTLLSPDGRPLQTILLNDTSPGDYIGKIDSLPEEQFSVYVSGKDSRNDTFGRVFPTVSQVTTITLQIVSQELYPKLSNGTPAYLNISVTNSGDADTFEATASSDPGFIVTIFPSNRFNINKNSSVILTLKLEANSTVGIGMFGTISLVVQGANSTSNFIVTQAEIIKYNDDAWPLCETLVKNKCSNMTEYAKCRSNFWNITIGFYDTGSGIKAIDPPGLMNGTIGVDVWNETYSGDCCNTTLSISVTDMAGNTHICAYDMKYDDEYLPTCETLTETKCPNKLENAKCEFRTWNATIRFNDTGSGIKMIDPPGDMSNNVGEKTLTKSFSGDCCNTSLNISITDIAGNTRVCSYDMKYDDASLPTCEMLTETKCPNKLEGAKCKSSTWNANIRFNDTGSGIKMIDPPSDMSNNVGEKTLNKSFSGDCCNTSLSISITDIAGNTRVCSYDMKYDDASLPTCEMLTETKCPNKLEGAKCKSSTWNANIQFNDTGSGIKIIDPPSDMSNNVGEKTLNKSFSGDCCNTSLSISITDIAGNTRLCSYDMKYDDASLPTCEMLTETKCPNKLEGAKCKSSTWNANIRFNDTGSGIKMIDPPSDMSNNVGEKTLNKSFSGDCCNTSLSISITDIAGNTRVCSYDMKYDDASLPTCEMLTESKCPNKLEGAKCKSSTWNANIRFNDTGSGIKMIDPPSDMSTNVGEKTLTKSFSGDCCNTSLSISITDIAGNTRVCSYDMKYDDASLPTCEMLTESKCPNKLEGAKCKSSTWNANIRFNDTGSGIKMIYPPSDMSTNVGEKTLTKSFSGDCCNTSLSISITDIAGNTRVCSYDMKYDDASLPTCEMLTETKCPNKLEGAKCKSSTWNANIRFNDTGSGIKMIDPPSDMSNNVGEKTLNKSFSGDCCNTSLSISITDIAGNTRVCSYDMKYDDASLPTCETLTETKCSNKLADAKCKSSTWNVTIRFDDTGSGIKMINPPGDMSNNVGEKTLTKSYSGDCCNTVFSVDVTDVAGNLRVCSYDMKESKTSAGFTVFHIGIWEMVILAFGLALSGITIVM
ncbi:uncharacterized protein LOC133358997 [Lethenteron reissneri]|uniref:uncharacterized protein LOC133358997 n=1 Tax=Lethenteron reissneri TaxID=7753 RepID=UPI002AB660CE|nr:uncharacterized protein LOC133358997 [Lethenteron reissneri]